MELNINCDLGEKSEVFDGINDYELLQIINTANIACGYHAGSKKIIKETIINAKKFEVSVGAHPGFNDKLNLLFHGYPGTGKTSLVYSIASELNMGIALLSFTRKMEDSDLMRALRRLPEDTILYPGHDYNGKKSSTIGNEKKFNPRLQVKDADDYAELMSNLNLAKPKLIDINVSKNIKLGAN